MTRRDDDRPAEPADAEPADAEPADAEPADAEPADAEPEGGRAAERLRQFIEARQPASAPAEPARDQDAGQDARQEPAAGEDRGTGDEDAEDSGD